MKLRSFLTLFIITVMIEISILITAFLSSNAAIHTLWYQIKTCCKYVFQGNHIPATFFILFILTVTMRFLFLKKAMNTLRRTKRSITLFKRQSVAITNPVIEHFRQSRNVSINIIADSIPFALTYGLIKPQIVLSSALIDLMSERELEAILEHEYYHCVKRDTIKLLFAYSASSSLFFLPLVKALYQRYVVEKELAADHYAIQNVGAKELASSLYKLLQHRLMIFPNSVTVGANEAIDLRIEAIISGQSVTMPISKKIWLLTMCGLAGVAVLITTVATSLLHVS